MSVHSFTDDNKFTNQVVGNDVSFCWYSLFLQSFYEVLVKTLSWNMFCGQYQTWYVYQLYYRPVRSVQLWAYIPPKWPLLWRLGDEG